MPDRPGTRDIPCPLPHCDWVLERPPPLPPIYPFGTDEEFSRSIAASYRAALDRDTETENALRAHLGSHDLAEWVTEVTRLRDENARLRTELEVTRA